MLRKPLAIVIVGIIALWSIFWLLGRRTTDLSQVPGTDEDSLPLRSKLADFPSTEPVRSTQLLPANAIPGEQIIHFSSREGYHLYLQQLSDLGLSPLGTIDSLLAIRVSDAVVPQINPDLYGGRKDFIYKIEQPLPPAEQNPELFAQLQAFQMSARSIVGGALEGDGSGVLVGVLDSGVEDHAYLEAVNIDSIDLTGRGISGAGSGHGTAVASIIAGQEGIAPAADLLVLRVLDDQGIGSSFDVAAGIVQAVDQGARVINLSLGLYQDAPVLREAVRYAHQQGVILVAAAGNDGYHKLPYPAAYPQVLSVTAVDGRGRHAVFPNRSKSIHLAAPGVGILTAGEEGDTQLFSGTSAAAPFVTGTLAALLSADPNLSQQQAVDLVNHHLDEAGAIGADRFYGGGLLNWDRLRERKTKDIADVALAEIYLQPDAQPGTTVPVEVTVQNRGTSWLTAGKLTVLTDDSIPQEFTVGSLAPGQTTTRKVYVTVPTLQSDKKLQIAARVLAEDSDRDVRPENNSRAIFFKPIQR